MGVGNAVEGKRVFEVITNIRMAERITLAIFCVLALLFVSGNLLAQQKSKQQWKTLPFAIVRYNDDAPKSWNVYRGDRKGIYLVRLWKRYLLIDTLSQSAFEIDPAKVKAVGESADLASADIPDEPIDISEWKTKDAGPVLRHKFRFGQTGNYLELQIPVLPNGKPVY